jgi:hypothetical protein
VLPTMGHPVCARWVLVEVRGWVLELPRCRMSEVWGQVHFPCACAAPGALNCQSMCGAPGEVVRAKMGQGVRVQEE